MEQPVRTRHLATLVAVCAGLAALVGCGGGSSPTTNAVVAKHPDQASVASDLDMGRAKAQQTAAAPHFSKQAQSKVSKGHRSQKGKPTPALSNDDHNPAGASSGQPNPCNLLTGAEAGAITGKEITRTLEAPLGPTCVYKIAGSKSDITLAIESSNLSQVTHHMGKRQQLNIAGHKAYCGKLGSQMLFVPLTGGRFLHVTAPCPVAQRLAAVALKRLP